MNKKAIKELKKRRKVVRQAMLAEHAICAAYTPNCSAYNQAFFRHTSLEEALRHLSRRLKEEKSR